EVARNGCVRGCEGRRWLRRSGRLRKVLGRKLGVTCSGGREPRYVRTRWAQPNTSHRFRSVATHTLGAAKAHVHVNQTPATDVGTGAAGLTMRTQPQKHRVR